MPSDEQPFADIEHALYDERFVTFGEDDVYQQSDAAGFIRLFGLSQRVRALKDQELAAQHGVESLGDEPHAGAVAKTTDVALAVA